MINTVNFIKAVVTFTLIVLVTLSCTEIKEEIANDTKSPGPNTLTSEELDEGWILLFDGKSFNGWRGIGLENVPKGHWKIEDGSIRKIKGGDAPKMPDGQPLNGGDLLSENTYQDFELSFEWKISEGGNSGIKYNVSEEVSINSGSSHALGFEYQVLDDDKHSDNLNPTHRTASLYDLIEAKNKITKPVGEFNTGKIIFKGNHGEHWLNGKKVIEFDLSTEEFDSLFRRSKYINHPNFTLHKDAHIVLQDHNDDVWYRNIKIRKLD